MREKLQRVIALGVSAASIGRATGIPSSTITSYNQGRRNISETNEAKLEEWLKTFKEQIANI